MARLPDFDTSRETTSTAAAAVSRPDAAVEWSLGHLATWDGVHFAHIAEVGYVYEHERAFFPLFPYAVSSLARCLGAVLPLSPRSLVLVSGAIISNGSFVLAAVLLFLYVCCVLLFVFFPPLFFALSSLLIASTHTQADKDSVAPSRRRNR